MNLGSIMNDPDDRSPKDELPFEPASEDDVLGMDERQTQRKIMEQGVRAQTTGLDRSARHGVHRVQGAAPVTAPERERLRAEDLSATQLLSFRGRPMLAADGREIGSISDVYLDDATGIPEWLGARLGSLMGSPRVVAPIFGAYVLADAISVPYAHDVVAGATVPGTQISADEERDLYDHFGVPMSHDRSPTGLPAGLDIPPVSRVQRWLAAIPLAGRRRAGPRATGTASGIGASVAVAAP